MRSLSALIHPYSVAEFLEDHWTRATIVIPNPGDKTFRPLLNWDKLSELLNFHDLRYPDLRLALDEKVLDASANEKLIQHCQQGATLIIDHVHRLLPDAGQFTSQLRYELGCPVQMNAYCSYPSKQGFSCHYDTHEVFILQVEGQKEWTVFADTFPNPLPEHKSSAMTAPIGKPVLRCLLSPGDVLYIPRGHWHYAIAADQPSLHLTLGIHGKTGIDVLEWLVGELKQQPEWRRSLPLVPPPLGSEIGTEIRAEFPPTQDTIRGLLKDLGQQLLAEPTELADRYLQSLQGLGKPIAPYALPEQAGFEIFPQAQQTKFTRDPWQRVYIAELPEQTGFVIRVGGKEISLKGVPKPFVDRLFQTVCFTGQDTIAWLPEDFDWDTEIAPLLRRLVMEGIIFVERQPPPERD